LEVPDEPSYFDKAILPVGGTLILHGPYKSFKSWIALDLMSSLAQAESWALFEAKQDPIKVAILNFEIPWAYYRERIAAMRRHATQEREFDRNLLTYSPLVRPNLVAGDAKSESVILRDVTDAGISAVLLDPVRRAIGYADPNAEQEVRRMLRFVERLNNEGIAVVLVHHDNKEGDKVGGGDPRFMTGSGAWAGDVDGIVSLTLPQGESRDTGTRRNMRFLLRNAPSPGPRGFELAEDARVTYTHEAFIETEVGDVAF
jgi:RecA-family ATPase